MNKTTVYSALLESTIWLSLLFQVTIQDPWLGQERSNSLTFSQPFSASARLATSGGDKFLELSLQTSTGAPSSGFTFCDPEVEVISCPQGAACCSAELMGDKEETWVRNRRASIEEGVARTKLYPGIAPDSLN